MTERQLLNDFISQIRSTSNLYIHKIGDTFGGHAKPADCFGTFKGRGFLLEAKKEGGTLSVYQQASLQRCQEVGGVSLIFTFIKQKNSERTIRVNHYGQPAYFYIFYQKGKYLINENTFDTIFLD